MSNLKTQLAETAAKSRLANSEKLCETLRKVAFDQALLGHTSLTYKFDLPVDGTKIKEYFTNQGVEVEVDYLYNLVKLSWQ